MKVELIAMRLDDSAIFLKPMDLGTFVDQSRSGKQRPSGKLTVSYSCATSESITDLLERTSCVRGPIIGMNSAISMCKEEAIRAECERSLGKTNKQRRTQHEIIKDNPRSSRGRPAKLRAFQPASSGCLVTGNINFAGSVQYDTQSLATATQVTTWFDVFHNAGFSNVTGGATGDFAGIAPGTQATMAQPWIFNPDSA